MSITRCAASLLVIVGLGAVLTAQAPALDIKLGLWEQTIVIKMDGIPGIDTSKMTPAQIAQMQAMMKSSMASQTVTTKTCMTKEILSSDKFMLDDQPGLKCSRAVTKNTRTAYAATITCTGERPMTGQITIDASSSSAYTGTMQTATTARGSTSKTDMSMTGKWLSAACGDVK